MMGFHGPLLSSTRQIFPFKVLRKNLTTVIGVNKVWNWLKDGELTFWVPMWSYIYICYRGTVNVLSGHSRWMFRKNSMEFFVGLQPYLYYYYSGCTLESHGHMSFPECSMVTWPCHMTWLTKSLFCFCLYSIVYLGILDWVFRMCGTSFPTRGSHNKGVTNFI